MQVVMVSNKTKKKKIPKSSKGGLYIADFEGYQLNSPYSVPTHVVCKPGWSFTQSQLVQHMSSKYTLGFWNVIMPHMLPRIKLSAVFIHIKCLEWIVKTKPS